MGSLFGGSKPKVDKAAQARQQAELDKVTKQEEQRKSALARSRRGRASLISGEEGGISKTLGG